MVNYISFLKSWGIVQQQFGSPLSRKRSSSTTTNACITDSPDAGCSVISSASNASYASSPFTSSPKRRIALHSFSSEQKQSLRTAIRLHLMRQFRSSDSTSPSTDSHVGVFEEVADHGVLYTSDLCRYLNRNGVACSLNQLCQLLAPFAVQPAVLLRGEFVSFVDSVLCEEAVSECLVDAFPSTFGTTTRIELNAVPAMSSSSASSSSASSTTTTQATAATTTTTTSEAPALRMSRVLSEAVHAGGLHRTRSVAQNLNSLPLYRLLMDVSPSPAAAKPAASKPTVA